MRARILLTSSAVLLAVSIAAASVLSGDVDGAAPELEPTATAPPVPVYVSPAPVAFDLESDNPAEL